MSWIYAATAGAGLLYYGIHKLQGFLIYPSNFPEDSRTEVDHPGSYNLPFEEIWLDTSDGCKLHAYYIPLEGAKKTVVMLGPNAGNIGHSLPLAQLFHKEIGVNVLTVSYRGYGRSTGSPSEKGIRIDAKTVVDYISSHSVLRDTSIVLYGRSLGGAVAIYMASIAKPLIKGLIIENSFLSIAKLIPTVIPIARPVQFLLTERWESFKTIETIDPDAAVLFVGGEKDELVPPQHFRKLYELCPSLHKSFKSYPNGTHNDTCLQPGYWRDLHYFLATCIPPLDPAV